MTMPHSQRPRRNRVNKKRLRLGLPPLPKWEDVPETAVFSQKPTEGGVTSMMIPLTTAVRQILTKVRREQQRLDPSTVASDQLYASAVLTAILLQLNAALFPSLIAPPTAKNMEQAQSIGKVLARPFLG
jgi:hypothetical protein